MENEKLLIVNDLIKHYPLHRNLLGTAGSWVHAVDNVSFTVQRGSTVGVVGESGCGKTTLGRCISRLEEPTSGEVTFDNVDFLRLKSKDLRNKRRDIQIIFQDPFSSLNPRRRVADIIAEPFSIHGLPKDSTRKDKIDELCTLVGLSPEVAKRYPHEFSGGQRQRVAIARSIALNPKLVIADEAVSALDVSTQAQIINLLLELQERLGLTYIFISHDLGVMRYISDYLLVMYLGRIVEQGTTKQIFINPLHPYTKALLSAVPRANPKYRMSRIILQGDIPSPINPPSGCHFHTRCSKAEEICKKQIPATQELKSGQKVACFFLD